MFYPIKRMLHPTSVRTPKPSIRTLSKRSCKSLHHLSPMSLWTSSSKSNHFPCHWLQWHQNNRSPSTTKTLTSFSKDHVSVSWPNSTRTNSTHITPKGWLSLNSPISKNTRWSKSKAASPAWPRHRWTRSLRISWQVPSDRPFTR